MTGNAHPLGQCICKTHKAGPWNRPEHWTAADVIYLEARFGHASDATISKHLRRSIVGLRLKAKRLGLYKRDAGMSSRDVARQFGIDETTVSRVWIARGLLRSRRGYQLTPGRYRHIVSEESVRVFIRDHGQYVDLDKMPPDSQFRDLAAANAFVTLVEVEALTGHASPYLLRLVDSGALRAARRGTWWYIRSADLPAIPRRLPADCAESRFRRQSGLEARRNRRKGVARREA